MFPNKSEKILDKLIAVVLIALIASALSALYINQTHATGAAPNDFKAALHTS